jgi:N-acetylglucosamine malate deacetylase 1
LLDINFKYSDFLELFIEKKGRKMEMETRGGQETTLHNASEYLYSLYSGNGPRMPLVEDPKVDSNSRVLVLAPHHDDPIIGCGGTMCKLAKRGAHVKVLYMTDYSYESNIGPSCGVVPLARKEAKESLARLRCFETEHLEMPCLAMRCDDASIDEVYRALDYYSPDLVFVPSLKDMHPDNMMTGLMAAHALREYDSSLTVYSYEVWGGLFPNTLVDITDVMEDKIAAIMVRHSQAKLVNGERRIREANAYRLPSISSERYCEPFLRQERKDFLTLVDRMGAFDLN